MGGVSARFADGEAGGVLGCATKKGANSSVQNNMAIRARDIFMQTLYQKHPEIGIESKRYNAGLVISLSSQSMEGFHAHSSKSNDGRRPE
jgi:hypothetical protein